MTPGERSFFIETFGCQMNVYDSGLLARRFLAQGYRQASSAEAASVVLVNGCSVRQRAEARVWNRVSELAHRRDRRGSPLVVLCGCTASRSGGGWGEGRGERADIVAGCGSYDSLIPAVEAHLDGRGSARRPDLLEDRPDSNPIMPPAGGALPLRVFVSISRGCDCRCAYCVVPSSRGPHRSRALPEILAEVVDAVEHGAREVTLLGQNVNVYADGGRGFPDLLEAVDRVSDLWRIRFLSAHPKDMSPSVLESMARARRVCEHLHLPLQSGCDATLEAMGRGYTTDTYARLVEAARRTIPGVSITTDLMVGFPGETEEDFRRSLEFIERMEFDAAFTFLYSARPGTRAENMSDSVPEDVKVARLRRLLEVQNRSTDARARRLVGQPVEVLVEGYDPRHGKWLCGHTRTHKLVSFDGPSSLVGRLVRVEVESAGRWMARGRPAGSFAPGGGET